MITKEYLQQELAKRIDDYKRGVETSTDNIIAEMKSILVLVNALPDYEKKYNEANKIYHLCFKESMIPQSFQSHNLLLHKAGAVISLKYRRGPLVDLRDTYLVFWYEDDKVWCSRVNTKLYGLDWQFFKDGHEMVECKDWDELTEKLKVFNEKGYCYDN